MINELEKNTYINITKNSISVRRLIKKTKLKIIKNVKKRF